MNLHSADAERQTANEPDGAAMATLRMPRRDGQSRNEVGWPLPAVIIVAVLLGGASRADVASLLILRPLAALVLVYALYNHGRAAFARSPALMALAFSTFLLAILHVIPLPPGLWTQLPGRGVLSDVYEVAQIPAPWLPWSMSPAGAWNALFSLFLPLATLILALAANVGELVRALRVFLTLGLLSGLIGLLQTLGSPQGSLYFYDITNNGAAVGLFSNRNHQAVLLASLFPILAMHVSLVRDTPNQFQLHRLISIIAAAFLAPLILITGSRNGLLLGLAGLILALWVLEIPASKKEIRASRVSRYMPWLVLGGLLLLSVATILVSRGLAFQRLMSLDASEDLRVQAFPIVWRIVRDVFPWGSGLGSFEDVYRLYEPVSLLSPNYLNHAHNDWLELVMTGGLPAILLVMWGGCLYAFAVRKLIRKRDPRGSAARSIIVARCAAVILLLLALGSVAEYPARTPSLAVLGVICAAALVSREKPRKVL